MIIETFEYSPHAKEFHLGKVQYCDDILALNAAHRDAFPGTYMNTNKMFKIASIPNVLIEKWMREDGLNVFKAQKRKNPEQYRKLMQKLKDPQYRELLAVPRGKL